MSTTITIKPPNSTAFNLTSFDTCDTTQDSEGVSTCNITTQDDVDITFGSDIRVVQCDNIFRGYVQYINENIVENRKVKTITAMDYTGKAKKIVVSEKYEDTDLGTILDDLIEKYMPELTRTNIETTGKTATLVFNQKFLLDAINQIKELSGYYFAIDEVTAGGNLEALFFSPNSKVNENNIKDNTYQLGTCNLQRDTSKLVNRLLIKGGKAKSESRHQQDFTSDGSTPIQLDYAPFSPVNVYVSDAPKTLGIQNITKAGTTDFLLNQREKLLIPHNVSGDGYILYHYEYPIHIQIEDPSSQNTYGIWEDILTVDTDNPDTAMDMGYRYLLKYSKPVIKGSLMPLSGTYHVGEIIKVEIDSLNINEYLEIKGVSISTIVGENRIETSLQLESPQRDLSEVLQDIVKRLERLEKAEEPDDVALLKHISPGANTGWKETEDICIMEPLYPADDLYPEDILYPA